MSTRLFITGIDFQTQTVAMSSDRADLELHLQMVPMLRHFSDAKSQRRINFVLVDKPKREGAKK